MATETDRVYGWVMTEHRDPAPSHVERIRRETTHEEIARRARALWEQYGQPSGRDEQIWLEAERQLRGLDLTDQKIVAKLAAQAGPCGPSLRPDAGAK